MTAAATIARLACFLICGKKTVPAWVDDKNPALVQT
jgi:hypothetical protein